MANVEERWHLGTVCALHPEVLECIELKELIVVHSRENRQALWLVVTAIFYGIMVDGQCGLNTASLLDIWRDCWSLRDGTGPLCSDNKDILRIDVCTYASESYKSKNCIH